MSKVFGIIICLWMILAVVGFALDVVISLYDVASQVCESQVPGAQITMAKINLSIPRNSAFPSERWAETEGRCQASVIAETDPVLWQQSNFIQHDAFFRGGRDIGADFALRSAFHRKEGGADEFALSALISS